MKEIFAFDSARTGNEDAFDAYSRLYGKGTDVDRTGEPFFARVRSWRLDRSLLYVREYGGVRHLRRERVASDGFDHILLHHVMDGELRSGPAGAPVAVRPGESILLDTLQPMESAAQSVRLITISLSREAALAASGSLDDLHGRVIDSADGGLLAALLTAVPRWASHLAPGAEPVVTRTLVDLLSIAVHPGGTGARSDFYRLEYVRQEAVRRLVEARLGDHALSVAHIVRETGISRATLYRLFAPQGGVMHFIQSRRLQRLRDWLDDRDQDGRALAELAPLAGFSDESHASRLFKHAFGMAPGAYRAASVRAAAHPTAEAMARRWNDNMQELH